jgi:hypothetical protein
LANEELKNLGIQRAVAARVSGKVVQIDRLCCD